MKQPEIKFLQFSAGGNTPFQTFWVIGTDIADMLNVGMAKIERDSFGDLLEQGQIKIEKVDCDYPKSLNLNNFQHGVETVQQFPDSQYILLN